jgi:hypothetical protein
MDAPTGWQVVWLGTARADGHAAHHDGALVPVSSGKPPNDAYGALFLSAMAPQDDSRYSLLRL